MKIRPLLLLICSFYSLIALSNENSPDDQFYKELLEKHQSSGQINDQDVKEHQFKLSKNKEWRDNFKQQVRGVASSMAPIRETIKLSNPAIEISVK